MTDTFPDAIQAEWKKMTRGDVVDELVVRPCVRNSWVRSITNRVNPYEIDPALFMSAEEVENLYRAGNDCGGLKEATAFAKDIANELNSTIEMFDEKGRLKFVLAYPDAVKNVHVLRDVSEERVGTNAVQLALQENRAIQLEDPEHFNAGLHSTHCASAPIHGPGGGVVGAINLAGHARSPGIETLGLVAMIAKIIDGHAELSTALDRLRCSDSTLREIIEWSPQGLILFDENGDVTHYNARILMLLGIRGVGVANSDRLALQRYSARIAGLSDRREGERREYTFSVNGRNRLYLVSTRNIVDGNLRPKGRMVVVEEPCDGARQTAPSGAAYALQDFVGNCAAIRQLKETVTRIASSPCPVLVQGDRGTGKELLAQCIHNAGDRRDRPFVAVNCGAIPADLIEGELFGYEPGAFGGALPSGKPGKLEAASGGTLFLDQAESLPRDLQMKLLRALSSRAFSRIGGVCDIPLDVRLISATKLEVPAATGADTGRIEGLRDDLYLGIGAICLALPKLADRAADIPLLVDHFVSMFSKQFGMRSIEYGDDFLPALSGYAWRGNVRELRNVIERSILLLGEGRRLEASSLPERITSEARSKKYLSDFRRKRPAAEGEGKGLLESVERDLIETVLSEEHGNCSRAARRLGISRPTLYKKLKQ